MKRIAAAFALLVGCASTQPKQARTDVGDLVAERGGPTDVIAADADEDGRAQIRERVDALLDDPLTLERAVQVAVLNNRELRMTLERLGVAQADLVQAGLLSNPTLSVDVVNSTTGNGLGGGLSLSQSLLSAFLIPAQRRLAKARLRQAVVVVSDATLALVRDVTVAYADLQAAVASAQLARTLTQTAEVAAELATKQHDAGNLNDLDRELFASDLDEARLDLADHELEVVRARERLNGLLGLWGPQIGWTLADARRPPRIRGSALSDLERAAMAQRLDVSAARANVEAMEYAIALRRRGVVPGVEVGVAARNEVGTDEGHEWVVGPELSIELPIFDPGHADFARLRAQLRGAQYELEHTAVVARSEVRTHRAEVVTAGQRLDYIRDTVLPRRAVMGQRGLERYNAMLIGAYELLELRAQQAEAELLLIAARRDYRVAVADLERAVGGKLPASKLATSD